MQKYFPAYLPIPKYRVGVLQILTLKNDPLLENIINYFYPRSGKLRENPFLNELHEEKPNFQNRDFADSIKCQSGNIAYIPSEPNAHGFLLLT